ncbi:MAG: Omp28-related outer membrane protein [Bacteroidia bacterium]
MKKIIMFGLAVTVIIIASCKKSSDDSGTPGGTPCTITANFTSLVDTANGQIKFTNASAAEATQFSWSFGDNTTSTLASPTHKYSSAGTFSVKLSVTSTDGKCTGYVTKSVVVPLYAIPVPSVFTKKALIEEFTGAWCGYCVDGAYIVETIVNAPANAGKAIAVSVHQGDGMQISLYNVLDGIFNNSGFPAGMVDRVPYIGTVCMNRGYWTTVTNTELAKEGKCGLTIKTDFNTSSDTITAEIHAGFKYALTGTYKMVAYLVEDSVTGTGSNYDQHNYYSSTNPGGPAGPSTHPYYNLPPVITGFKHMQVVRKVMPTDLGEVVTASTIIPGGRFAKTYKFPVGTMKKGNLSIVAFVYKVGTSATTYEIMNVQKVKAGSTKSWD